MKIVFLVRKLGFDALPRFIGAEQSDTEAPYVLSTGPRLSGEGKYGLSIPRAAPMAPPLLKWRHRCFRSKMTAVKRQNVPILNTLSGRFYFEQPQSIKKTFINKGFILLKYFIYIPLSFREKARYKTTDYGTSLSLALLNNLRQ